MKSSQKYTLDDLERLNLFPNGERVKQTKDKAGNPVSSFSMDGWEKKQLSEKAESLKPAGTAGTPGENFGLLGKILD